MNLVGPLLFSLEYQDVTNYFTANHRGHGSLPEYLKLAWSRVVEAYMASMHDRPPPSSYMSAALYTNQVPEMDGPPAAPATPAERTQKKYYWLMMDVIEHPDNKDIHYWRELFPDEYPLMWIALSYVDRQWMSQLQEGVISLNDFQNGDDAKVDPEIWAMFKKGVENEMHSFKIDKYGVAKAEWVRHCWWALHMRAVDERFPCKTLWHRVEREDGSHDMMLVDALEDEPIETQQGSASSAAWDMLVSESEVEEEPPKEEEDFEWSLTASRIAAHEECQLRETLHEIPWLRSIDNGREFHPEQQKRLANDLKWYLANWEKGPVVYLHKERNFCQSTRAWVAETLWCLDALKRWGQIPACLYRPSDRAIRPEASMHKMAEDPGNMAYEMLVNILRLWDFVAFQGPRETMERVSQYEYGHRANKSGRGPVNLRGNVVEALLHQFQKNGEAPSGTPKGSTPHRWKGWHSYEGSRTQRE